ncbi:hypothetical protein FKM82_023453 [Ascaphus truei]
MSISTFIPSITPRRCGLPSPAKDIFATNDRVTGGAHPYAELTGLPFSVFPIPCSPVPTIASSIFCAW